MKIIVTTITILLSIAVSGIAWATTYYVDATAGSDSYSGTSTATPWKTVAKVNTKTFSAGDTILFKRGCQWREQLVIPTAVTGTALQPVTFGAYSTGSAPIISGAERITGWEQYSGSIYRAPFTTTADFFTNSLSLWLMKGGRSEWGRKRATLADLQGEYDWTWESGTPTSYLYLYAPGAPAAYYDSVEAATARQYGIVGGWNGSQSYIHVQDLEIRFVDRQGIYTGAYSSVDKANNSWTIERVVIHHVGGYTGGNDNHGINIVGTSHIVRNNTIYESVGNGINAPAYVYNATIEKNLCYNNHHHQIDVKTPGDGNVIRYNAAYVAGMSQNVADLNGSNSASGIVVGVAGISGTSIVNTVIYGNTVAAIPMYGFLIDPNAANTALYNNTIFYSGVNDFHINNDNVVIIKNNIAMNTGGAVATGTPIIMRITNTANKILDHNNWYVPSGYFAQTGTGPYLDYTTWTSYTNAMAAIGNEVHSTNANPLFIDSAGYDFRLQPASPAIDSGTAVGITKDFAGRDVPYGTAVDIGAYEYVPAPAYGFAPSPAKGFLVKDFGPGGIWIFENGSWRGIYNEKGQNITASSKSIGCATLDATGTDSIVANFGSGYGLWVGKNNAVWTLLRPESPRLVTTADIDGSGIDDLVVDFGSPYGIWVYMNNTGWLMRLHEVSAESITAADIDGNGKDDLLVDFGPGYGIWLRRDTGSWTMLHIASAKIVASGDIDGNGKDDLIIDFGSGYGIWVRRDTGSWTLLQLASARSIVSGDLDASGKADIICDFGAGYGLWIYYNNATWTKLIDSSADSITVGDIAGNVNNDIVCDFGSSNGIWIRKDNTTWEKAL